MNGWLRFSRTVRSLSFLLIVFCDRLSAQDTVSISDFRYPETMAVDWKGGLNGTFQQVTANSSPINPSLLSGGNYLQGTETSNAMQGNYNANTTFLFFHSKENHDHTFQLSASGSFSHSREDDVAPDTVPREQETTRDSWRAVVSENWSYLHYLTDQGIHFVGTIATDYQASGLKYEQYLTPPGVYGNSHEIDRSYFVSFRGSLGIGYGRLRDGTFVFRALRIVERLREDGLITRPLSRGEMLGLVDRIAQRREYTINFERPDKYFVRDIVNELTQMGVVTPGAVTPYSTLRIGEGLQENLATRMFGWRIDYSFVDVHTQWKSEHYYSDHMGEGFSDGWGHIHEFGFEFGHPISLFTHLSGRCILDVPAHEFQSLSALRAGATISHQVGERLEIDGTYEFLLEDVHGYSRSALHTLLGNFVYFLEDRLRFVTEVGYGYSHYHVYREVPLFDQADRNSSRITLSFGIVYNII